MGLGQSCLNQSNPSNRRSGTPVVPAKAGIQETLPENSVPATERSGFRLSPERRFYDAIQYPLMVACRTIPALSFDKLRMSGTKRAWLDAYRAVCEPPLPRPTLVGAGFKPALYLSSQDTATNNNPPNPLMVSLSNHPTLSFDKLRMSGEMRQLDLAQPTQSAHGEPVEPSKPIPKPAQDERYKAKLSYSSSAPALTRPRKTSVRMLVSRTDCGVPRWTTRPLSRT